MVLVAWAASFGLNECGFPDTSASADGRMTPVDLQDQIEGHLSSDGKYMSSADVRRQWRARTEVFVREILELIDAHGILRRPTLDGVRLLLLLLPLLEGERLSRESWHPAQNATRCPADGKGRSAGRYFVPGPSTLRWVRFGS